VVVVVGGGMNIVVVNAVLTCIVVVIVDLEDCATGTIEAELEVDVDAVGTITGGIDVV
jgi:hypothetical protein